MPVTPKDAQQIPIYYDANGNYIGPLRSFQGAPIISVTAPNGNDNVLLLHHLYDHNNAQTSPNVRYVGLMTSTSMLENLTLQVFADVPAQSSSSSQSSSAGTSSTVQPSGNGGHATGVNGGSGVIRTSAVRVSPANNNQVQATAPTQVSAPNSSAAKNNKQLPATGDQQGYGLVFLGILGMLAGLGLAWGTRHRAKH